MPCQLQRHEVAAGSPVEFVVADSPVVVSGGPGHMVGIALRPVALGDANQIWMPLSPRVAVCLTSTTVPDQILGATDVPIHNRRAWSYATRHLVARLGTDLDQAFGRHPGHITIVHTE